MKKGKLNLRNVVVIAICLAVTTMFSSCEKEDKKLLIGKWVTSDPHTGDNDTIIFTENSRVQLYFDHFFANERLPALYLPPYVTYSLSNDNITFTIHRSYPYTEKIDDTYKYVLNRKSLTIKRFDRPFAIDGGPRRDMHFIRVE